MHFEPSLVLATLDFRTLPEQLVNGLLLGAIYALIALGYTMVYGVLRLINFAHGEVYMLGAYTALLTSYALGFSPDALHAGSPQLLLSAGSLMIGGGTALVFGLIGIAATAVSKKSVWIRGLSVLLICFGALFLLIGRFVPPAQNLIYMALASMVVCAVVGVLIERFAYRPMRNQSRIASLITAIGVSLTIQYGGALFLPVSPKPSIDERVNPFQETWRIPLSPIDSSLKAQIQQLKPAREEAQKALQAYEDRTHESEFELKAEGQKLKEAFQTADSAYQDASRRADNSGVSIHLQAKLAMMFFAAISLMLVLRHLVMATPAGRAMRAVSHDFDSASLMGINVDRIITFTFIIGSALAGAGAMMTATFQGTNLDTFYGLLPGVKAFVAAVIGGIGNIPGAVVGGLLMGVVEVLVVWAGYSNEKDAIAFVVLIVVLLFKPGGLMGSAKVEKV
jgi:branched-chain amino acid transport system permease protein